MSAVELFSQNKHNDRSTKLHQLVCFCYLITPQILRGVACWRKCLSDDKNGICIWPHQLLNSSCWNDRWLAACSIPTTSADSFDRSAAKWRKQFDWFYQRKFERIYCVRTFFSYAKIYSHEGVDKTVVTLEVYNYRSVTQSSTVTLYIG